MGFVHMDSDKKQNYGIEEENTRGREGGRSQVCGSYSRSVLLATLRCGKMCSLLMDPYSEEYAREKLGCEGVGGEAGLQVTLQICVIRYF